MKINDDYVFTRLKTMGKLAMLMLEDLNTAVKTEDLTLIKEIIERDKDIDDLYINIVNTTYLIDNDPFVAGQAHLAARHLERIGDHISNIAESVYYYLTGEHYDTFDSNKKSPLLDKLYPVGAIFHIQLFFIQLQFHLLISNSSTNSEIYFIVAFNGASVVISTPAV